MSKLKICGIKDEQNAYELSLLNIDFFGLIFAKSPRQVSIEKGIKLAKIIHENNKKVVGVFVDEDNEMILQSAIKVGFDGVQIHKTISKEFYTRLKKQNLFVWQVVSILDKLILPQNAYYDYILFDTKGKFRGGNGTSFDWSLLENFKKDYIIAGGIGLSNIKDALNLKPFAIDINSKVEIEPGLKNVELIKELIKEFK
ncbi:MULTISPECIES: phosphoribosylanthranilate isomerase [unclassified Campylobacter]|uniref:phosphoribosylanthranilate isomerase n=1 Tax=unclassified Campylobacter TaxID=2593542 RepID=UPI00123823B3|nr:MULTISPECIES: phosphoribosylanthranilate isomerase [unclassified Campylobacter]KAA6227117.1 phosphoribosylanthranilate isomerase [Campylobacter sp. LR185c]KAA6227486.1 phosphoribosylanthranilate isomerase [Campylobacter sp. LR196d]KAA6228512.1 phosphoribosylanthranilate isomerase [Campylobacter sp. LR286c]KAA6230903.1 phosphoribosylanthranilate isomerase [Campylobacter sp. LR291e]KAA6233537.1 phosphoribosylanthranilate isomerase [Campylobacter sp. LR264d]